MEMKEVLDKAGDSVSKLAKNVGNGSKKLATKVKLNKSIHDAEKTKEKAYMEIGKQCFQAYEKGEDADTAQWIEWANSIIEAELEIAECRKSLAALEDAIVCSSCGNAMLEGQNFCPNCGAPYEPKKTEPSEEETESKTDIGQEADGDPLIVAEEVEAEVSSAMASDDSVSSED